MQKSLLLLLFALIITNIRAQNSHIISRLEVFNIVTSERTLIREYDYHIEAPNWTPDGEFLVYNSHGLIYRIPASGGDPVQINTGNVTGCNNDHVISFDGTKLYVSAAGPSGRSQIYMLPLSGGEPKQITKISPSYLHGISPDGKYLAYCAFRNGNMDVWVIPADGGEEVRLTDAEGLDDGPEYSPDGEYIWFNSVRTGLMQVWRMKTDGSEQKRMTTDESNDWFPHVSPDGEKVVYITYYKDDVEPGAHPANKNVELRMMSSEGGAYETLVRLFGGQGSLNVNSWAPDSKRFAFVSYEIAE